MHLQYQTKLQAQKALSKNGKVLNGRIMIGVQPCTDSSLFSIVPDSAVLAVNIPKPDIGYVINTGDNEVETGNKPRPDTSIYNKLVDRI